MATKSAAPAASEEASVMRQLELLLVPLHHRFRYPLPVPAHLASQSSELEALVSAAPPRPSPSSFGTGASSSSPVTAADGAASADAVQRAEEAEDQLRERVRRAALALVEEQVPDLLPWQTRVQAGAAQAASCYQVLEHVRGNVAAMQRVTETVQQQSDHLSHNASAMMVRKAKLELVRDALEQNLAHFTHIDDLCREASNPFLKAGTVRFSTLLQDIAAEMDFLSTNTQYKSAKPYAMRLAVAQQMVSATLKEAVRHSLKAMEAQTKASAAFVAATHVLTEDAPALKSKDSSVPGADKSASPSTSQWTLPDVSGSNSGAGERDSAAATTAAALVLRQHDVAGSFVEFLAAVNDAFVAAGDGYTSLRRMVELRQGGFGYSGAEAFGEEMLTAQGGIEADAGMREVLDAYRDARVGVVVPLLRYWLTLWYYLDVQAARSEALSASEANAAQRRLEGSDSEQLHGVAEAHTLPQLTEHICSLLQRSLSAESAVLGRLWLRDDITSHLLPKLVSSIAEEVYYTFRSRLLCVDDVGELARTVESIQRVSLRQDADVPDTQVVADLWLRMIQDTQERLVFRTSVFLRQHVARCTPTREEAMVYLRCGTGAYNASPAEAEAATKMFFIPGVVHALQLLHWLYPTLEFSVFSVFAEEAVHHSLELVRQLVKLMRQLDSSDALRDTKAFLCQLSHLQHLEAELSHVDANITVVERHINFASLRKSRLELEQSSRESKKEVQVDLLKCSEQLTTAMLGYATQPMSGAAKKSAAEQVGLVAEMKGRAAGMERMVHFYVAHGETRTDLVHILRERTAELAAEVGLDIQDVPAATVSAKAPLPVASPQPVPAGAPSAPMADAGAAASSAVSAPRTAQAAPVAAGDEATTHPAEEAQQRAQDAPSPQQAPPPPPQVLPPAPPSAFSRAPADDVLHHPAPQRQRASYTSDTDLI